MQQVLVYGGSGGLGRAIVARFKQSNFKVISVDFSPNSDASENIILNTQSDFTATSEKVMSDVNTLLKGHKLDAVLTGIYQ